MSGQETPGTEPSDESAADGENETAKRIADLEASWRRTAAELDNFRKRCARDLIGAREQERATAAARWLPVLDNLERALEHASADPDQIVEGVRSVYQQSLAVLAAMGYPRREDEAGAPFDPARHEAVGTVADADRVPGTVAHVIRSGYGPDTEILRPASVIVATRGD